MAYCAPLGIPLSRFLGWNPEDQDAALAWRRVQAENCNGCGTRKEEWDKDRFAYIGQQRYCPGCELLEMEQDNVREGAKGMSVYLTPRAFAKEDEV